MSEFVFKFRPDGASEASVSDRLTHLQKLARQLEEARWPIEFCVDGLGFDIPDFFWEDDEDFDPHKYKTNAAQRLEEIGIKDEFDDFPGPTLQKVLDVHNMLDDDLEKIFPRGDRFESGFVMGQREMLTWILGTPWLFGV